MLVFSLQRTLKANQMPCLCHSTGSQRGVDVQGARAPMFPDPEPVPDWDEFGGVTDLAATFGKVRTLAGQRLEVLSNFPYAA